MTLAEEFHQEMLSGVQILKKQHGYNPTYFIRMVAEHGGVGAAKLLLASQEAQAGLTELYLCGRLDLSMENVLLDPKYKSLFSPAELQTASHRLRKLRFTPGTASTRG